MPIGPLRRAEYGAGDGVRRADRRVAPRRDPGADSGVPFRLDVDLARASTVMRMQVVSTGSLLEAIDGAAQERFEDLTYSAYARLNEERREILEQIRREGRVHGG